MCGDAGFPRFDRFLVCASAGAEPHVLLENNPPPLRQKRWEELKVEDGQKAVTARAPIIVPINPAIHLYKNGWEGFIDNRHPGQSRNG